MDLDSLCIEFTIIFRIYQNRKPWEVWGIPLLNAESVQLANSSAVALHWDNNAGNQKTGSKSAVLFLLATRN